MKAALLTGIRQMEIGEVPAPSMKRDSEVLLKIQMVGVCGSDVHYYETGRIGTQVVEYPFIVGHECAATVEDVGKAVTRVRVGDRVAVDPAITCRSCDQCLAGRENTCRNLKFLGCPGQVAGCLCEYIVMPEHSCYAFGDDFTFERAVLSEPLAIGLYAVQRAKPSENASSAILGAGPIGLSCLLAAKTQGKGPCYITEKIAERTEIAKNAGAQWVGNPEKENVVEQILEREPAGVDVVYECAGQQETIDQAIELLKPGGKFMLIGIPRQHRISLVIDRMRRKEVTLMNVRRQSNCTQKTIDLIKARTIDPDFMVTHRFSLEQSREAFELVAGYHDGVVKAMIEF